MRSILMYQRDFHDGGRVCQLNYFLLIDEVFFGCSSLDIYGAKIELYSREELLEQKVVRGITPFGPRIASLLLRLADGLVLPARMEAMLSDVMEQPQYLP